MDELDYRNKYGTDDPVEDVIKSMIDNFKNRFENCDPADFCDEWVSEEVFNQAVDIFVARVRAVLKDLV